MSREKCPNCGYNGPYKRAVCPNCGFGSSQDLYKLPLWLRLILGTFMFGIGAFGTCLACIPFVSNLGPFFLPGIVIGGGLIAYGADRTLFLFRPPKRVLPDNDIRLAPPEDRRGSDSNAKGDK